MTAADNIEENLEILESDITFHQTQNLSRMDYLQSIKRSIYVSSAQDVHEFYSSSSVTKRTGFMFKRGLINKVTRKKLKEQKQ